MPNVSQLSTLSENGIELPLSSHPYRTLALLVTCRCACACSITFEPGIFANVLAALRAAADRAIRVSRLSFASISLRTSAPLRTFADRGEGMLQRRRLCPGEI